MDTLIQPLKPASEVPPEPKESTTAIGHTEIRAKGKPVFVPSVQIGGRTVITSGKWLKTASVRG